MSDIYKSTGFTLSQQSRFWSEDWSWYHVIGTFINIWQISLVFFSIYTSFRGNTNFQTLERIFGTEVYLQTYFPFRHAFAISRLVHNGGYIQKLLQLLNSLEILWSGRLYLVTKVLLNLDQFYRVLTTIQYFRLRKSTIMDQFVTLHKRVHYSI